MKIRTNLFFLFVIFAVLITAIGLIMFHTFDHINREIKRGNHVSEMIRDVFELNIITYEYLMHNEERMQQQWLQKHDTLGEQLEMITKDEGRPPEFLLEPITMEYELLGKLFSQLQASFAKRKRLIQENKPQAEIDFALTREERLIAELLMTSQKITSEASRLSAMTEHIVVQAQQRANLTIILSIIGFLIFASCILLLTIRAITVPVNELVRGTEIIGGGDLKHRVEIKTKNEISELAVAFNQMTEARQRAEEELRAVQEELIRKEKLAVLGQLAGSVGHELRNPLGVIKNASYFLNMVLEEPEPEVKDMLEMLNTQVARSEGIISSLLGLARPQPLQLREVSVNDIVQETLSNVTVPEDVRVVEQLDEALPIIMADPDQLGQVFENIISNAIQAMPEGGQLLITSEMADEEWIQFSFSDTGMGIPSENLEKLFEPLFTTKARGIGLGLAIVRLLVEGHGGSIDVQSEAGKGSTFSIRLPKSRGGEIVCRERQTS